MFLGGPEPFQTKNYRNYVIPMRRVDAQTGEPLTVPWLMVKPFRRGYLDSSPERPAIEGAANGSEGTLID